jgi:predicted dehydrogenase
MRYIIIGCGGIIAATHIQVLQQMPSAQIVGMADVDPRAAARAAEAGSQFYADYKVCLAETKPDIAIITTPHPFHAPIAIDCFAAGAHVLVEKPIAVQVAEADRMLAAAEQAGRILAVNFQQRFRPVVERAKAMIASGELGDLVRVLSIEPWYRTKAYFDSASWRGTWKGEGGGVLMNQAPHSMDVMCHLAGQPVKVWGWTRTRKHAIETEDTAQAMFEFANGAPGYLMYSTVEPGARRLQIVGDKASLEMTGERLTISRYATPLEEFRQNDKGHYSAPAITTETLDLPPQIDLHLALHRDLEAALTEGRAPRITGREGIMALELANAIALSSHSERAVTLPLDRAEYSALLERLRGEVRRTNEG